MDFLALVVHFTDAPANITDLFHVLDGRPAAAFGEISTVDSSIKRIPVLPVSRISRKPGVPLFMQVVVSATTKSDSFAAPIAIDSGSAQ